MAIKKQKPSKTKHYSKEFDYLYLESVMKKLFKKFVYLRQPVPGVCDGGVYAINYFKEFDPPVPGVCDGGVESML